MTLRMWSFAFTLLTVTVVGCSGESAGFLTEPRDRLAANAGILGNTQPQSQDEEWARLSDSTDGAFAGLYLRPDGQLVISVTRQGDGEAVRLRVARIHPDLPVDEAVIGVVEFSFRQLMDWREQIYRSPIAAALVYADIDEVANRLDLAFRSEQARTSAASYIRSIGIPDRAVLLRVDQPFTSDIGDLTDYIRPVPGGVRLLVGNNGICTLGANIKLTQLAPPTYFITAGHCTAGVYNPDSVQISQPDHWDPLGYAIFNQAPAATASCPYGHVCKLADALLGRYNFFSDADYEAIARPLYYDPTSGSLAIIDMFEIGNDAGWVGLPTGFPVSKIGQTTGWTIGYMQASCFGALSTGGIWYPCSHKASYGAGSGDSGAPVILGHNQAGPVALNGIHVGRQSSGSAVFQDMFQVRAELMNFPLASGYLYATDYW